ncbi:MAG: zinc ribbon domain-containing protein [Candidatus Odinarchaeota archaeon]
MERYSQNLIHLTNKSFGDVLRDGFRLFFKTYKNIILPLALFQILLIILNVFLLTDLNWYIESLGIDPDDIFNRILQSETILPEEMRTYVIYTSLTILSSFLQQLIGAIIIVIAMCSVGTYVYKIYMKEDVSFIDSFKSAFNKKIFLVILILGICLPASYIIIIPVIFIFTFFIFSVFTYNMEIDNNTLSEARAIAKGNFWKIIGVFIINFIIIFSIGYIFTLILNTSISLYSPGFFDTYTSWKDPSIRNYGGLILIDILYNIIDIILAPLFICLLTALFSSSKAKKELKTQYPSEYYPTGDMYQESYKILRQDPYQIIETEDTTTQQEARGQNRIYCPYCGTLIETPKRYCPKCGENLENLI